MKKLSILSVFLLVNVLATAQLRSDTSPDDQLRGYQNILEVGYSPGVFDNSENFFKLNMIYGHRFRPYLAAGLGTGFKYSWNGGITSIPVFADFRGNMTNRPVSPYWAISVGYTFDASNKMKGLGLLFNPQVGMKFKVSGNRSLNIGLGYEFQRKKLQYIQPDLALIRKENVPSMTLHVAFTF